MSQCPVSRSVTPGDGHGEAIIIHLLEIGLGETKKEAARLVLVEDALVLLTPRKSITTKA